MNKATIDHTSRIAYLNSQSYAFPMELLYRKTQGLLPKTADAKLSDAFDDAMMALVQLREQHSTVGRLLSISCELAPRPEFAHDCFDQTYSGAFSLYMNSKMIKDKKLSRELLSRAIATLATSSARQRSRAIFDLDTLAGQDLSARRSGLMSRNKRLQEMDTKKRAKTLAKSDLLGMVFEGLPETLVNLQELEILRAAIYMELGEITAAWFALEEYEIWRRVVLAPAAKLVADCAKQYSKECSHTASPELWHRALTAKVDTDKLKQILVWTIDKNI